ncbi:MAG TPA: hypothetical protein VN642_10075, partial [Dongiaceae bacterium]|nr:hypothetical protein [Dongiaceae bacterium]
MAQLRFKTRISLVLSLFFICLMALLSVGTVALHTKLIRKSVATSQNQILTEIAASLDDKMMTARDLVARVADWATRSGTGPEKLVSLEQRG